MTNKKFNLLVIVGVGLIFATLIYLFSPSASFQDPMADQEITASIVSIKKVLDRSHQVGIKRKMVQLTVKLPNGEIATAFGLAKQLSNCTIDSTVNIRANKQMTADQSVYRLISNSCP